MFGGTAIMEIVAHGSALSMIATQVCGGPAETAELLRNIADLARLAQAGSRALYVWLCL